MYYIGNNDIVGKNKTIMINAEETAIINFSDLLDNCVVTMKETDPNGILFRGDKNTIGGELKEVKSDGTLGDIKFLNDNSYYKKVKYSPNKPGTFTLQYALKVKATNYYNYQFMLSIM